MLLKKIKEKREIKIDFFIITFVYYYLTNVYKPRNKVSRFFLLVKNGTNLEKTGQFGLTVFLLVLGGRHFNKFVESIVKRGLRVETTF